MFYNTSSSYYTVCSPPQVKSPSTTIYAPFTLFYLPPSPFATGIHHILVCVHKSFFLFDKSLHSSHPAIEKKLQGSQETPLTRPMTHLVLTLRHIHSGIQHQGNSWKGTSGIRGESEVQVLGDRFLLGKTPDTRQQHCPLCEPSPTQQQSSDMDRPVLVIT